MPRDGVSPGVFRGIACALALYAMAAVFVGIFIAGIYAW